MARLVQLWNRIDPGESIFFEAVNGRSLSAPPLQPICNPSAHPFIPLCTPMHLLCTPLHSSAPLYTPSTALFTPPAPHSFVSSHTIHSFPTLPHPTRFPTRDATPALLHLCTLYRPIEPDEVTLRLNCHFAEVQP